MENNDGSCTLSVRPPVNKGQQILYTAELKGPGAFYFVLQFRLAKEFGHLVSPLADAFVLASLFHCQFRGSDLLVEGASVSSGLISNLQEFQHAWACWRDNLQVIDIHAQVAPRTEECGRGTLTLFSSGVDSAYCAFQGDTAWGQSPDSAQRPDAGLFVHGFDIPLSDVHGFEAASQRGEAMLADLGIPLLRAQVNLREMGYDWEDCHGLACAAALSLFGLGFQCGLIPSSATCELPFIAWGSNPLTDPLLSSDYLRIRHHGASVTRLQKVESLLQWPAGMSGLRFCWLGKQRDRNCGKCGKCVLTALEILVFGGKAPCFDKPVTKATILELLEHYPSDPMGDPCFAEVLVKAREKGLRDPVYDAIDRALQGCAHPPKRCSLGPPK